MHLSYKYVIRKKQAVDTNHDKTIFEREARTIFRQTKKIFHQT